MRISWTLVVLGIGLAVPAVAQQTAPPPFGIPDLAAPGATVCTNPRPQICTMDYRPVCGYGRDGARRTYSNRCVACRDIAVLGTVPGPCK